jgi:beta-glucuronidase
MSMGYTLNRKNFLKMSGGAAAGLVMTGFIRPVMGMGKGKAPAISMSGEKPVAPLLILNAEPPAGTTAIRYYIDGVQVCELTNLYALQTLTKPVWRTAVGSEWFKAGSRKFRIEADTPAGTLTLKDDFIFVAERQPEGNTMPLSGGWRFAVAGDLPEGVLEGAAPRAAASGFDDTKWPVILVPNSLGYVNKKWNQPDGVLGIYRRTVTLDPAGKDEQVSIVLQSCYWAGRVFVNGTQVGDTKGGYLPSRFDITDHVHKGRNVIAVIVDNRLSTMGVFKRLHAFYWNWGGLLQEVSIVRNSSVAVIDMRATGSRSGDLRLWLTTVNKTASAVDQRVYVEVLDPEGEKVLGEERKITLSAGEVHADPIPFKLHNPSLWNPDTPHLYTVILKGPWGTLRERTGFRDVAVSGSDLTINGKVIGNLQGFDRHEDYPGLGRTQPPGIAYKEMKELYDKGFRIFRPAHYPTTPAQLDAADELGMLVLEEINVTGLKGAQLATDEVKSFAAAQLTKLIHRDRSHPCIFAWSVGNENLTDEQGAGEYIKETIHLGRSLDGSRLFTHVTMRATRDKTFGYQDFVAQNYYAGWYTSDVNAIVGLIDSVQNYAGNKPILLSEYGAEAVIGRPGMGKGTEFYQAYIVDGHNRLLDGRKHFIGKLYWSSTEFWCRPGWTGGNPSPVPPFHVKGLQGYFRERNKLGWKVMFSPVRLAFEPSGATLNSFGAVVSLSQDGGGVDCSVTVREVRGAPASGTLVVDPPLGFKCKPGEYSFSLKPHASVAFQIHLDGKLPSSLHAAEGMVRAVIDEDTEALPLLLTVVSS